MIPQRDERRYGIVLVLLVACGEISAYRELGLYRMIGPLLGVLGGHLFVRWFVPRRPEQRILIRFSPKTERHKRDDEARP